MLHPWSVLVRLIPALPPTSAAEKLRGAVGALFGLVIAGAAGWLVGGPAGVPLLIAPFGASAVLLFAVPASPLAQPWSILGGNLVAALVGVTAARIIPEPLLAAPVAAAVAIAVMGALRCLHPPSGAVALTAVLGGPAVQVAGYGFVLWPVLAGSAVMVVAAMLFNNGTGKRWPHLAPAANAHGTADPKPTDRVGVRPADLDRVLQRHDELIDVDRRDLGDIVLEAEIEAEARRFGALTCGEVMSRDVAAVTPVTSVAEAALLMTRKRLVALPVVDSARRVVGLVGAGDLARPAERRPRGLARLAGHVVRLTPGTGRPVADVLAATPPAVAAPETPLVRLVPMMADGSVHAVPVVDADGRLAGIVTQSDMIAALFRGRVVPSATAAAG